MNSESGHQLTPQEMGLPNSQPQLETATINGEPQGKFAEAPQDINDTERYHGIPQNPVSSEVYDRMLAEEDSAQSVEATEPAVEVVESESNEKFTVFESIQSADSMLEKLLNDPENFQQNTIDIINLISSHKLRDNESEGLSSALLQQLEYAKDRNIDPETASKYMEAMGKMYDTWGATADHELTKAFNAKVHQIKGKPLFGEGVVATQPNTAPRVETPALAPEPAPTPTSTVAPPPMPIRPDVVVAPPAEVATLPVASEAAVEPVAAEPVGVEVDAVEEARVKAEQEAAEQQEREYLQKLNQLIDNAQVAWDMAPSSAKNSLDLRPLYNKKGFVRDYVNTLRRDIAEGKNQYGYLRVGAGENDAARQAKLLEEVEMLKLIIDRESKAAPEVSKAVAESDKVLESKSRNVEAKIQRIIDSTPYAESIIMKNPKMIKASNRMKNKPSMLKRLFGG